MLYIERHEANHSTNTQKNKIKMKKYVFFLLCVIFSSAGFAQVTNPVIVSSSLTPLQDGFRLPSVLNSGNDSAVKTIEIGLDSLFMMSYIQADSIKFKSISFASSDSSHGILTNQPYWVKLKVVNSAGYVQKVWKVVKPQLPQAPYVTMDSLGIKGTAVIHFLKVVSFTLNTQISVYFGVDATYGGVAVGSVIGAQGESVVIITTSGLKTGTTYYYKVVAQNASGKDTIYYNAKTSGPSPFSLDIDSARFFPSLNGLYVYYKGTVPSPSTSKIYLNLSTDSTFYTVDKSVLVSLTGSPIFVPGPFTPGRFWTNLSGSDGTYGYSDQSDSVLVRISIVSGVDDLSKPIDFTGQYQLYDTMGKLVAIGDVERGDMFSLKIRELSLPSGIYLYNIRSDKDPSRMLSGKIGRW